MVVSGTGWRHGTASCRFRESFFWSDYSGDRDGDVVRRGEVGYRLGESRWIRWWWLRWWWWLWWWRYRRRGHYSGSSWTYWFACVFSSFVRFFQNVNKVFFISPILFSVNRDFPVTTLKFWAKSICKSIISLPFSVTRLLSTMFCVVSDGWPNSLDSES